MYLGRKLGRTVRELRESLTPREFQEHLVYDLRLANKVQRQIDDAKRGR